MTRDEAKLWFNDYLISIDEVEQTGLVEFVWSLPEAEYDRHVEFVWECLKAGIKPRPFVKTIAEMWGRQLELIIKSRAGG